MVGVKTTGCSHENTLLEQCDVEDVFRREWILGPRSALRAVCDGVLEDALVEFPCDDCDVRLRMQWHERMSLNHSGQVVPLLNRDGVQLLWSA